MHYLKAKLELMKLEQEEDGLETIETVILIGIAVVIAVILLNLLTGSNHDGKDGLIHTIFDSIEDKIKELFGTK